MTHEIFDDIWDGKLFKEILLQHHGGCWWSIWLSWDHYTGTETTSAKFLVKEI